MRVTINDIPCAAVEDIFIVRGGGIESNRIRVPVLTEHLDEVIARAPKSVIGIAGGIPAIIVIADREIRDLRILSFDGSGGGTGSEAVTWLNLVDRRFFWAYKIAVAAYNVKRATGEKFTKTTIARQPEVTIPALDLYEYRPSTLTRDQKLYTVRQAFKEQLEYLGEVVGQTFLLPFDFGDNILATLESVGPAPAILDRILSQDPEFKIVPDDDGTFTLAKMSDPSHTSLAVAAAAPYIDHASSFYHVDLSQERPSKVKVYFNVEQEIRFWSSELRDEFGQDLKSPFHPTAPRIHQVIQNPFRDLTVDGKVYAEGTWMPAQTFFKGLPKRVQLPVSNVDGPLTYAKWRRYAMRPWEFFAQFAMVGRLIDDQWLLVWNTLGRCMRQTFQIEKGWWDRIRAIVPKRVTYINEFDLTRAEAPVYCDYIIWPSNRLVYQTNRKVYNKHGFVVESKYDAKISDLFPKRAPANVTVIDPQSGVIGFNFKKGTFGEEHKIIPGSIAFLNDSASLHALDVRLRIGYELEPNWGASCILSVVPYFWPNKQSLHAITVSPKAAETRLGSPLGECNGPEMEVYVDYSEITVARFRWDDSRAEACITPFFEPDRGFPTDLLSNGRMLSDVALAIATKIYADRQDRLQGTVAFAGEEPAQMRGNIATNASVAFQDSLAIRHGCIAWDTIRIAGFENFLTPETKAALHRMKIV